ncbi:MAG: hypothetical protein ACYDGM_04920 [Vulcanimicrobiaceae bacterium]
MQMTLFTRLAMAAILVASTSTVALAQQHCSRETLMVRGTPVTIGYCVQRPPVAAGGGEMRLPVEASYSTPGGSFTESTTFLFVSGEGPARILQSVKLARLGLAGTLHLTLQYGADGALHIESAMLTPGAITIK